MKFYYLYCVSLVFLGNISKRNRNPPHFSPLAIWSATIFPPAMKTEEMVE